MQAENEETLLLARLTAKISYILSINRIIPVNIVYWMLCVEYKNLLDNSGLFDKAIAICREAGTVSGITKNGIAYQASIFITSIDAKGGMQGLMEMIEKDDVNLWDFSKTEADKYCR